jgi:Flp pilus assembly protein TadB
MKSPKFLLLILPILLIIAGCYSAKRDQLQSENARSARSGFGKDYHSDSIVQRTAETEQNPNLTQVSLNQADQSQSMAEAIDRKIIRNAELTLEVGAPAEAQRKITSIAESLGGFVVTSESKLQQIGDSKQELLVNLVIRVPATQFGSALDQIRNTGSRVLQEKMTGQDVTEEFIDLEARIKTQKALELQFLEIMKQASKVPDALEVQRQIAEVRTEIEKLEGRKRFLENRASLSTITVNLQSPSAIAVNTSGFGRNIREAIADSVELAFAIVLFLIRLVIVMIPILILVILPGWFLARLVFRRTRKLRLSRAPKSDSSSDSQSDSKPEIKEER